MHSLTFALLWILVCTLSWEQTVSLPGIGTVTRLVGMGAVGVGALALMTAGRFRQPGLVLSLATVFLLTGVSSLGWTISYAASRQQVITYAQLLALVWMIWEFARSERRQQLLMLAYCLGAYVSIAALMVGVLSGAGLGGGRYSALGLDPNDFGLTLVIGIPLAWYLYLRGSRFERTVGAGYIPLAVLAVLLTASRGAFLSALLALAIIPITLPRQTLKIKIGIVALMAAGGVLAMFTVPESGWERLMSTGDELRGGTMSGRLDIWQAGLEVFWQRPLLGFGVGAFGPAVENIIGRGGAPHNVFIAILVEQGIVGMLTFAAILVACGVGLSAMRGTERKVWAVVGIIWCVGAMSLGWHYRKVTWLVVGMTAAQVAISQARRTQSRSPVKATGGRAVVHDPATA